jgi:hypothetical protein
MRSSSDYHFIRGNVANPTTLESNKSLIDFYIPVPDPNGTWNHREFSGHEKTADVGAPGTANPISHSPMRHT